ncbi:acyltransferase family protein [Maribacter sp. X9]|uniref:acyltransferase family protein n=1 Tax=Maribacter sp. X9 TaxID=3402159 RepID=UPI003AF3C398
MRITKLDGLRGIFSFMIIFFHYDNRILPEFVSQNFVKNGAWIFVEFFFVLSGYVISYNYDNLSTKNEFWIYLKKRFIRLYPLLFFTIMVYFLFELLGSTILKSFINTPETVPSLILATIDSLLFTNSTPIFGDTDGGMNSPSWSISAEMISYIVFGLATIYLSKKNKTIFYICLILVSMSILLKFKPPVNYFFLRAFVSFSLGYLLFKVSKFRIPFKDWMEYLIPIALLLVMYMIHDNTFGLAHFNGNFTINIIFFFSILMLLKTDGTITRILDSPFVQFLGKISYSVYLNHLLIITVLPRFFFKILKIEQNTYTEVGVLIFLCILILVYSALTYKYIELKGSKFLKSKLLKR